METVIRPSADLARPIAVDATIISSQYDEIYSKTSLDSENAVLEFTVEASESQFLDLNGETCL